MKVHLILYLILILIGTPALAQKNYVLFHGEITINIYDDTYTLDDIKNIGIEYEKIIFDRKNELVLDKKIIEDKTIYKELLIRRVNEYIEEIKSTSNFFANSENPSVNLDEIQPVFEASHYIPINVIETTYSALMKNILEQAIVSEYKLDNTLSIVTSDITIQFKTTKNKFVKKLRSIHVLQNGKIVSTKSTNLNSIHFTKHSQYFYLIERFMGYEGHGFYLYRVDKNGLKLIADVYEGG